MTSSLDYLKGNNKRNVKKKKEKKRKKQNQSLRRKILRDIEGGRVEQF